MNDEDLKNIKEILEKYKEKIFIKYENFLGTIALRLNDYSSTNEIINDLNEISYFKTLWTDKAVEIFGNSNKIHANDTARNILTNLAIFGVENTLQKICYLINKNKVLCHTIYTLEGIIFDNRYEFWGTLRLLNQPELPDSLLDSCYRAVNIENRISSKSIYEGTTAGIVYSKQVEIIDYKPMMEEDLGVNQEALQINKFMQILALLIPLTTYSSCHLISNYTCYDNSALIGTDSGASRALPDLSLNFKRKVSLDKEFIEELGKNVFDLERDFHNHIMTVMRRFNNACARDSEVDVLIELRIVIESLLGKDRGIEPISHVISQRGAWVLGSSLDERMEIASFLKEAYSLSSKAVHGDYKANSKNYEIVKRYKQVCSQIIIYFIKRGGLPNSKEWTEIILGSMLVNSVKSI